MTKSVRDQHSAHFGKVAAYAILDATGAHCANISVKFPGDGAGRRYAYVHWHGAPMVRGSAGGYGYDKSSAAIENAANRLLDSCPSIADADNREKAVLALNALADIGGSSMTSVLTRAGFTVLHVL